MNQKFVILKEFNHDLEKKLPFCLPDLKCPERFSQGYKFIWLYYLGEKVISVVCWFLKPSNFFLQFRWFHLSGYVPIFCSFRRKGWVERNHIGKKWFLVDVCTRTLQKVEKGWTVIQYAVLKQFDRPRNPDINFRKGGNNVWVGVLSW